MIIDYMFELPYPLIELNPNKRIFWAKKHKASKIAKETARLLTREAIGYRFPNPSGKVFLDVKFFPPDKRKRDGDNANAAMKHYYDGIADALGVDDNCFVISYQMVDKYEKKVLIHLSYDYLLTKD